MFWLTHCVNISSQIDVCVKLVCMWCALCVPAPRLSLQGTSLDGQRASTWPTGWCRSAYSLGAHPHHTLNSWRAGKDGSVVSSRDEKQPSQNRGIGFSFGWYSSLFPLEPAWPHHGGSPVNHAYNLMSARCTNLNLNSLSNPCRCWESSCWWFRCWGQCLNSSHHNQNQGWSADSAIILQSTYCPTDRGFRIPDMVWHRSVNGLHGSWSLFARCDRCFACWVAIWEKWFG